MERRQFDEPSSSDDASLCYFFQEKDESSHISCKHRLTRSKFNYNPFGLRFGKRNEATTTDTDRPKHKHLLPMMLYLRKQLETSWKSLFNPMEGSGLLGWKLWVIISGGFVCYYAFLFLNHGILWRTCFTEFLYLCNKRFILFHMHLWLLTGCELWVEVELRFASWH